LKNPSAPFSFSSIPEEENVWSFSRSRGRNPENVLTCHCQMTSRLPFYHRPLLSSSSSFHAQENVLCVCV
jgi:hypothetical protein